MMKRKILIFISAFFLICSVSGQSTYDILLKAKALTSTGKPSQAEELLNAAPGIHSDVRLLAERAEARIQVGDYKGAIDDFNSANKITQYSGDYGLARIYAIKGDAATALYHLDRSMSSRYKLPEKVILLEPAFAKIESSPEWRLFWKKEWYRVPERKLSEVEYYVKAGNIDEAGSVLLELERDYKDHQDAIYAGSIVKCSTGKYGEAIKSLSDLLTMYPERENYLRALAFAQSEGSNPAGASATYSSLISLEIPDAELFMLRAECYRKTGEKEKAISDIKRYLSYYPGSKAALSLAGKTESSSGNNLKALEYFSENLRLLSKRS